MALKMDFLDESTGVLHKNAYFRLQPSFDNFDGRVALLSFAVYRDRAARLEGRSPIQTINFTADSENYESFFGQDQKNFRAKSYDYLKLLPEFVDATDVVEN